jgi:hypothetical protein
MAKVSGLGGTIIVQDATSTARTITNDCTNFTWSTPRATQDITGVDKSAHEQLLLLADYSVTLNGIFDSTSANMSHAVFATVPSTSVTRSVSIAPTSNSSTPILAVNCILTDYQITRANTGELTWQVPGQLADGNVPTWA